MLTAALIAAALLLDGGQVTVIATTPASAEARAAGTEGATRRVCRLERATGSNLQQRVCRNVAQTGQAGVQDQQTREFLDAVQAPNNAGIFGIPTPGIGGVNGPPR